MQTENSAETIIFSSPAHFINRAGRLFTRIGEVRLRAVGFSTGHIPILAALRNGRRLPQKTLAKLAQIEQPTMAQTLSRMERDGLIERKPDSEDKRSSLISLCPMASERIDKVFAVLRQGNEEALAGFSDAEKAMLTALLRRVVTNLEAAAERSR